MIKQADLNDLQVCSDVIVKSFLTIAEEFGITSDNAPKYVAFSIDYNKLKQHYANGFDMYTYIIDKTIVGFVSLCYTECECELNHLCVLPAYRHCGIGETLLRYAIQKAQSKNVLKLTLSILEENTKLKEWYSSFGFVHTHTKKFDCFPFTCGYMELTL